jgi:glycopeptide antibiotics resistance protein
MLSYQTQHHHLVMPLTILLELAFQTYHSSNIQIKGGFLCPPFFMTDKYHTWQR